MYRTSSNQRGDLSEQRVATFIMSRGMMVLEPKSRDATYDLVIENGKHKFETVQVKTMQGNSICKEVDRSNEVVCKDGKTRNSINYAEEGIDWLIGVHKETGECYCYKHETYSEIPTKSFSVLVYPPDEFPTYVVPSNNKRKKFQAAIEEIIAENETV